MEILHGVISALLCTATDTCHYQRRPRTKCEEGSCALKRTTDERRPSPLLPRRCPRGTELFSELRGPNMRRSLLFAVASIALGVSSADADVVEDVHRLREQSVLLVGSDAETILAQEWTKFDLRTLERRGQALRRVRALGKRLAADQNAHRSRDCSAQIFLEAKWRAIYTADFETIERRIRDLEASLGNDNQAYVAQQSPVDGSWGVCFEPMFMKLEATMFALQRLHRDNGRPSTPSIFFRESARARMSWPFWRSFLSQMLRERGSIIAPNWRP